MRRALVVLLFAAAASAARAQEMATARAAPELSEPPPIQDNSFLIEEAYNQEPGIVQHINLFQKTHPGGSWLYTFTQEWPVPRQTHQLSYTLPYQRLDPDAGDGRGLGDVALNYRYQLLGNSEARVAVAPRLTLLLPTGDDRKGLGTGSVGVQVNVAASSVLSERFVAHWNAGATWIARARNTLGQRAETTAVNLGQSTIFHAFKTLDLMLEVFWARTQSVAGPGIAQTQHVFLISPGLRYARNFSSGLQIVPGIGVPLGVGPSRGQRSVLLYLSFEHPFRQIEK